MTSNTPTDKPLITFGFLLVPLQLLDIAGPIDVLSSLHHEYIQRFIAPMLASTPHSTFLTPDSAISQSLNLKWHYIGPTMSPVLTTGGFYAQPTCTIDDCPPLDYLVIGGPNPNYALQVGSGKPDTMPTAMADFIRARTKQVRTVFTTCTGAVVLAATGVLDGHRATVNHACKAIVEQALPKVKWEFDANWVIDGPETGERGETERKFWTAAGATAGMDMFFEWAKGRTSEEMVGVVTMMLEYTPRDVGGKPLAYVNGRGERVEV